ncbi:hypothetical protein C6Y62_08640 [Hyphomicrobium sulfonivorans]|nr:hypothetical protein [Hyphomicrobium sulfonivorans]
MVAGDGMLRIAPTVVPVAIASVAGVLAWDLMRLLGEGPTLWASWTYWWIGLPIMLFAAFTLGLGFPRNAWRWGLIVIGAQLAWSVGLAFINEQPLIVPDHLAVFAIVGLACVVAALAGGWLHRRLDRQG